MKIQITARFTGLVLFEHDAEYTRKDIQREKSLEYSIDEAYAAYEERER